MGRGLIINNRGGFLSTLEMNETRYLFRKSNLSCFKGSIGIHHNGVVIRVHIDIRMILQRVHALIQIDGPGFHIFVERNQTHVFKHLNKTKTS